MAKKGIMYVCVGKLDEKTGKATEGKYFGKTESLTGTINKGNAKDYGDSVLAEEDTTPSDGSLVWVLLDDEDEIYTYLLGHEKTEETGENAGEINFGQLDAAPFVSVACYGMNGSKYTAKGYRKVKFSEADDAEETKKESTTFGHITLNGTIYMGLENDVNHIYKTRKTFDTAADALAWCKKYCGVTDVEPTSMDDTAGGGETA